MTEQWGTEKVPSRMDRESAERLGEVEKRLDEAKESLERAKEEISGLRDSSAEAVSGE